MINPKKHGHDAPYFCRMQHLEGLNEAQRKAVMNTEGPTMVIAGAGSGKTRVLTHRIAHLVSVNCVDPFHILALTFTNKAAKEMKERIAKIVGEDKARSIWMGTFHSVFARILRVECEKIGYPRDFTIYDTADTKNLIKAIVKEMGLDEKLYKPSFVYNRISGAKNNLIGPSQYLEDVDLMSHDASSGREHIGKLYKVYAQRCFKAGAMDFDDLLFKTNELFRDHPDAMLKYQNKFRYILVDEYQDTNMSQYLIVKTLAARHQNLCVVGDDSQSIYAFRGANIQNILNFKKDNGEHKEFKLEQNYRSTKTIVQAANGVIKNNKGRLEKTLWTDNPEGDLIRVQRSRSDNEEGQFVANDIFETKMNAQAANSDIAILYRTNAQSRAMEEALRKLNIPYRIYGGLSFYQRKEVKDLISYFRLTANPNDEEALKRVINYPIRGIGKTTVEKLMVQANETGQTLWTLLNAPAQGLFNAGTRAKLVEFGTMIKSFQTMLGTASAYDLGEHIAKSTGILKELYTDKSPEGISRYENIQELLNGMRDFSEKAEEQEDEKSLGLGDFLIDVALLTDADQDEDGDKDHVTLMTIHAAKGLEFPYVYIVGLEENLFPSQMSLGSREELEEERRLFYVALTRAEKRATLSYATTRYRWGDLIPCEPSRFIDEVEDRFLDIQQTSNSSWGMDKAPATSRSKQEANFYKSRKTFTKPAAKPLPKEKPVFASPKKKMRSMGQANHMAANSEVNDIIGVSEGSTVEHLRFGKGKVVKLEGAPPNVKATVFFPSAGQKQLLLKFAKLKLVEQ